MPHILNLLPHYNMETAARQLGICEIFGTCSLRLISRFLKPDLKLWHADTNSITTDQPTSVMKLTHTLTRYLHYLLTGHCVH